MFNSLVKVVLIGLLSMLAVGSLSAQTLKVVDAYHYIKKQRSCLKYLVEAVQFGTFSDLTVYKCDIINGKVNFIVNVKLSKPYSNKNTKQFSKFVDAFGFEVGISKKSRIRFKFQGNEF